MTANEINATVVEFAEKYPPIITADQAADISHRGLQTIYEWSSQGVLDSCKVRRRGRLLLYRDAFVRLVLGVSREGE